MGTHQSSHQSERSSVKKDDASGDPSPSLIKPLDVVDELQLECKHSRSQCIDHDVHV